MCLKNEPLFHQCFNKLRLNDELKTTQNYPGLIKIDKSSIQILILKYDMHH